MATLNDLDVDQFLLDSVNITPEALNEEYVRLPADMAYWGEKLARASKTYLTAKYTHEHTMARLYIEVRERLLAEGTKTTEALIDAHIATSKESGGARLALVEAEVEYARLRALLDAVKAKRDMLVSFGATVRAEMQGDPQLRAEMRGARMDRQE